MTWSSLSSICRVKRIHGVIIYQPRDAHRDCRDETVIITEAFYEHNNETDIEICNFPLSMGLKSFHSGFRFYTVSLIWKQGSSLSCYMMVNLSSHEIHTTTQQGNGHIPAGHPELPGKCYYSIVGTGKCSIMSCCERSGVHLNTQPPRLTVGPNISLSFFTLHLFWSAWLSMPLFCWFKLELVYTAKEVILLS